MAMNAMPAATMIQYSGPVMKNRPFSMSGVSMSRVAFSGKPMISRPMPPTRPPSPPVAFNAKVRMEKTMPSARRPVRYSCSSATSASCESKTMLDTGRMRNPANRLPNSPGSIQTESFSGKSPIIFSACGSPTSAAPMREAPMTVRFLSSRRVSQTASGSAASMPGIMTKRWIDISSVESSKPQMNV